MKPLTPNERRELRARAHHLDPVVIVGHHGLTASVLHEIDVALSAHQLVKLRVAIDDRDARSTALERVCAELDCAPVQHLGKVLVLWRPNPEAKVAKEKKAVPAKGKPKGKGSKRLVIAKSTERTPLDPVRARRRARSGTDEAEPVRGRRGAARHLPADAVAVDAAPAERRRKSTYTPKSKPKSFSAKPNPRAAWEKPAPASGTRTRSASTSTGTGSSSARKRKPAAAAPAAGSRRRRSGA